MNAANFHKFSDEEVGRIVRAMFEPESLRLIDDVAIDEDTSSTEQPPPLDKDLYTLIEVAQALCVSRATLYNHVLVPGGLPSVYIGQRRMVRRKDLLAYIDRMQAA